MESQRQQKYARLIQKELADIFLKDTKSLFGGTFISVTTVRVSPDLGIAKVYLSFILVNDKKAVLEKINDENKAIRNLLAKRIKNQARVIPQLNFFTDDNVEYASNIDSILSKINIPPKPEKDDEEEED